MPQVTTVNLNVRTGPGTQFETLETLPKGRSVEVVDIQGWTPISMEDDTIGWVSSKYLQAAPPPPAASGIVVPGSKELPWIAWSRSKIGTHEMPGAADNPDIVPWYGLTTLPKSYWHDSTAWCAVFVNAALMKAGIKTNRSARAFDWLEWGEEVDEPQVGDVVVFDFSHVAFYLSGAGTGRITCIGGNQSDAVTITTFSEDSVSGYRRVPS